MEKSKSQEAALKLINDIAIIDTELAAQIKPTIDMFIESFDVPTDVNNDFWSKMEEFFALPDDKEVRRKWAKEHEAFANKVLELSNMKAKKQKSINEVKEIKNGEPTSDIPIKGDEQPETEISARIPEDGFKDNQITYPTKIEGDEKKLMGRPADDIPTPEELDPNKKAKIIDGNEGQVEIIKTPDPTERPAQIELNFESARNFFDEDILEKIKTVENKEIVTEAVDNDKYTKFLDQCQLDWAMTNVENGTVRHGVAKFIPIRRYATQLYNKFKEDFGSYDDAIAVAKEWYSNKGKRTREADRIIPSNVYVELRKGKDSNFVVNVYLVKTTDLDMKDAELASDLFSAYTDTFIDDKPAEQIWIKLPKPLRTYNGVANVYMISLPFTKENKRKIILSRVKHDIVNMINADYKDYYIPTTKVPSWVYAQNESLNENINNLTNEQKIIFEDIFKELLDRFKKELPSDKKIDINDAFKYIYSCFGGAIMQYASENGISDEEYDNLLDVDMENVQDLLFRFLETII